MNDAINAGATYPHIRKACFEISYDNGGVNRHRSERQVASEMDSFLSSRPYSDHFAAIDAWLADLSNDDIETICAGEQTEADAILLKGPPFTATILEEYFDEVC